MGAPSRHPRPLLKPEDACAQLGWSRRRLNRAVKERELKHYDIPGVGVRFDPAWIDSFERKLKRQAKAKAKGLVYFVQSGESGPVKIGWTSSKMSRRLSDLQYVNPEPLKVLAQLRGFSRTDEKRLHVALADYRLRGEWFEADAVIALLRAGEYLITPGVKPTLRLVKGGSPSVSALPTSDERT